VLQAGTQHLAVVKAEVNCISSRAAKQSEISVHEQKRAVGTDLAWSCPGGKFVVSGAGGAYDVRARGPKSQILASTLSHPRRKRS
jgi:hypothetical protein